TAEASVPRYAPGAESDWRHRGAGPHPGWAKEKGTSLISTVRRPSANPPECHEPLGRSRSTARGDPLAGTRESWAAPLAPRKVLHDAANPAPNRKRPWVPARTNALAAV